MHWNNLAGVLFGIIEGTFENLRGALRRIGISTVSAAMHLSYEIRGKNVFTMIILNDSSKKNIYIMLSSYLNIIQKYELFDSLWVSSYDPQRASKVFNERVLIHLMEM